MVANASMTAGEMPETIRTLLSQLRHHSGDHEVHLLENVFKLFLEEARQAGVPEKKIDERIADGLQQVQETKALTANEVKSILMKSYPQALSNALQAVASQEELAPQSEGVEAAPCCEICLEPCRAGWNQGWIAIHLPTGKRPVPTTMRPAKLDTRKWSIYHPECVQRHFGHAKSHDFTTCRSESCHKPNGPCTDWHIRGKCKRAFDCGHCHFAHPELVHKYPQVTAGGTLKRPQKRERCKELDQQYQDAIWPYSAEKDWKEWAKTLQHTLAVQTVVFQAIQEMDPANAHVSSALATWRRHLREDDGVVCLFEHMLQQVQQAIDSTKEAKVLSDINALGEVTSFLDSDVRNAIVGQVVERTGRRLKNFQQIRFKEKQLDEMFVPIASLELARKEDDVSKIATKLKMLIINVGKSLDDLKGAKAPTNDDKAGFGEVLHLMASQSLDDSCRWFVQLGGYEEIEASASD